MEHEDKQLNLNRIMKGHDTFTMDVIKELYQLFLQKDNADYNEQKSIRRKIREKGFYISDFPDFAKNMNSTDFRLLCNSGRITITDKDKNMKSDDVAEFLCNNDDNQSNKIRLDNNENLNSKNAEPQDNEDFKEGLKPWVDEHSEILILGSLPSDVSIRKRAYYQNKSKNSFWKLMHGLFGEGPDSKEFLMKHHIALWDCLAAANREGSLDSNILGGERPNNIQQLLESHPSIRRIVINGKSKAKGYFDRYFSDLYSHIDVKIVSSSSNANSIEFEAKLEDWKKIMK